MRSNAPHRGRTPEVAADASRDRGRLIAAAGLAALGAAAILSLSASSAGGGAREVGQPPPEWSANAGSWPSHNYDLANTRATTETEIDSSNVAQLRPKWRFRFRGASTFGAYSSTPIVVNGTVYLQDLNSNVYALDRASGRLKWRRTFNSPSTGPNGVAYGWGALYGVTEKSAFALNAQTGRVIWNRRLVRHRSEGIDVVPQLYDGTVVVSTVPVSVRNSYLGGAMGIVYALDATTGKVKWRFNTVKGGAKLWGNPNVNNGGGFWYPPAVDDRGRVFIPVANPAPFPGTPKYPNGSSRPGPNLYTNSLVVLDGETGRLLWYRQALPHDVRDYDLQISPVLATVDGVETVMVAGKMGKVYAYRSDNGRHLWTRSVGRHQNDIGALPRKAVAVYPGIFGGVETPMAFAEDRLFVPWLDLPTRLSATGADFETALDFGKGRGGFTAVDAATGRVLWERNLLQMTFGAATVANDVVFTSTYDGTFYAFDTGSGRTLLRVKARAGINSFPAIDGDTVLVGAGRPASSRSRCSSSSPTD